MASLHPQLASDTVRLGRFKLCHLLLVNDANYPWFILVPDREDITEIYQLHKNDQQSLLEESVLLSEILAKEFTADKLNIAALGNIVPQLHIHHIVRYKNDPAWPAPVWGQQKAIAYSEQAIKKIKTKVSDALKGRLSE
jgi:diadenosine tetraphosphate (Ap4A) HIT family hydrolase